MVREIKKIKQRHQMRAFGNHSSQKIGVKENDRLVMTVEFTSKIKD